MRLFFFALISFNYLYSQSTIDFEQNGVGADWTWAAPITPATFEIVDNPLGSDNVNSSSKVGKLTLEPSTLSYGLVYSDGMDISFTSSNAIVTMDVYKTRAVDVAIKFEIPSNSTYREVKVTSSGAAGWETLTFDFSDQIDNGVTYTRIVIIPDFAERTETTISYFDNIQFSSDGSESSDPSDATLQNLYIDGAALTRFSSNQYSYTYTLDVGDTTVPTVTATASNPSANVSISPASAVSETTTVTVTSEDGTTTQDYTIAFQASYWDLKWSDEFNDGSVYTAGQLNDVDPAKWHHQTYPANGGNGWFNGEQQHYTDRIDNSYVSDGTLKIKAIEETYQNPETGSTQEYTSARLNSKYAFTYGKMEVRAKLPSELGTWPAIWTLGQNITETGAYWQTQGLGTTSWPACGEIDIMEQNGWDKNVTYGYMHFRNSTTGQYQNEGTTTPINDSSGTYHIYSLIWTEDVVQILLDDNVFFVRQNTSEIPYDNLHYILLNIAMGGNLGLLPGTEIPESFNDATMEIDYVRVYEQTGLGVSSAQITEASMYPNPARETVEVALNSAEHIQELSLYDITGKLVLHKNKIDLNKANLDISNLHSGLYIVAIKTNTTFLKKRLLVQ